MQRSPCYPACQPCHGQSTLLACSFHLSASAAAVVQEADIPYEVEVLVEATDESVSGVGDSICKRAEELGAAAVSSLPIEFLRLYGSPVQPDVCGDSTCKRAEGLENQSTQRYRWQWAVAAAAYIVTCTLLS